MRGLCESVADLGRTELLGRVLLAKEFGASRQKHFVCLRSKVVRSKKFVPFQPINGKLPGIHVRWNEALDLPSSHDLHVVEVTEWSPAFGAPDRRPRGRYVQSLRMQSLGFLLAGSWDLNFFGC